MDLLIILLALGVGLFCFVGAFHDLETNRVSQIAFSALVGTLVGICLAGTAYLLWLR